MSKLRMKMNKQKQSGFTLIELMIVVVLSAILLGLAVPSFTSFIERNRVESQLSALTSAVNLARVEAIRRGSGVTICPSTDGKVCADISDWTTGWIVFVDPTNRGKVDTGEVILRIYQAVDNLIITNTTPAKYISFGGTGIPIGAAAGSFYVKVSKLDDTTKKPVADDSKVANKCIAISGLGLVSQAREITKDTTSKDQCN